jgi:acyl-CoA dehydrogenase
VTSLGVEHDLLRESMRAFAEREIVPYLEEWERAGGGAARAAPQGRGRRAARRRLSGGGLGGAGGDFLHLLVVTEELIGRSASSGLCAALFTHGIALPHIVAAGV